jgi:GNAT superfamily N-acetyltransferase
VVNLLNYLVTKPIKTRSDSLMIHQLLDKVNKDFFYPESICLNLLKNCPQVIPILAQWLYEEWYPYDATLTKEKLMRAFNERLNADRIPITFVVLRGNQPIGVISLKEETNPVFADFPRGAVWMGSLHVLPEERKHGIGHELLQFAATVAKHLGYEKLYFYTSNPQNVNWYVQRGAQIIEKRLFRDHPITVMFISQK